MFSPEVPAPSTITGTIFDARKEGWKMKKSVITLIMSLCAVAARADVIVIPFSGSGSSGTIAPGEFWSINDLGTFSFGSPGVGAGILPWPGPPTPGDITDFTITFTGLPAGVTINPTSLAT